MPNTSKVVKAARMYWFRLLIYSSAASSEPPGHSLGNAGRLTIGLGRHWFLNSATKALPAMTFGTL
jgi:hypothetical protein